METKGTATGSGIGSDCFVCAFACVVFEEKKTSVNPLPLSLYNIPQEFPGCFFAPNRSGFTGLDLLDLA